MKYGVTKQSQCTGNVATSMGLLRPDANRLPPSKGGHGAMTQKIIRETVYEYTRC